MNAIIEIAGQTFAVEVDRTIPKGTIRVGSLDAFLTAMSGIEAKLDAKAAEAAKEAGPGAPNGQTRRIRSHVKLGARGVERVDVLAALANPGLAGRLDPKVRDIVAARYGQTGLAMTYAELCERFDTTQGRVAEAISQGLSALGFSAKAVGGVRGEPKVRPIGLPDPKSTGDVGRDAVTRSQAGRR